MVKTTLNKQQPVISVDTKKKELVGAKPLTSYRVIVNLISATTTCTGLSVHCELDTNRYPKAIVVTDEEMDAIDIKRANFHGEWNYTIRPINRSDRAVDS